MGQNNWKLAKIQHLEQSKTLFEWWKYNQKPNPRFQAVIHRPNLCYSKISKRWLRKEYTISSGAGKNTTSQTSFRNGVLYVLAWVTWVRGCIGGVLTWVARVASLCGWCGSMGDMGGLLTCVACYYYCYCCYWNTTLKKKMLSVNLY